VNAWAKDNGMQLANVLNLIGSYQTDSHPNGNSRFGVSDKDALDYRNSFIQLNKYLQKKPTEFVHLFVSRLFIFWPENVNYHFEVYKKGC